MARGQAGSLLPFLYGFFIHCSTPVYPDAIPLSLLASQIAPTAASFPAGQPRLLHPGISCFVTSARSGYAIRPIQVIDGERTFTFPDLQPCRLLQCLTSLADVMT